VDWEKLDGFEDRLVFQSREWLEFLAETQQATPVVAELCDGSSTVGYFNGLMFRRFGVRLLGSPFPGWTTPSMGFNLLPGVERWRALEALERFAFQDLKCLHLEVADRYSRPADGLRVGFSCITYDCLQTDLGGSEEEVFSSLTSECRRKIRKAEKNGVQIEKTRDEHFADDYFDQLTDVFAKQGLVPSFDRERTRKLIQHLLPTGRLLLLRARDPEGQCIGTGIYAAMNKVAEFWGNASFRSKQHLIPNEAIHWYAIRHWKEQGMDSLNWGPRTPFKEKLGGQSIPLPWFRKSRFAFVEKLRQTAAGAFELKQNLLGKYGAVARGGITAHAMRRNISSKECLNK